MCIDVEDWKPDEWVGLEFKHLLSKNICYSLMHVPQFQNEFHTLLVWTSTVIMMFQHIAVLLNFCNIKSKISKDKISLLNFFLLCFFFLNRRCVCVCVTAHWSLIPRYIQRGIVSPKFTFNSTWHHTYNTICELRAFKSREC